MQEMVGMLGGFIIHPATPYSPPVDKDYLIALQEYAVLPDSTIPNSMKMEFNWLTFNGRSGPAATPLIIRQGDRVRIRIINLGMDHHPIHLHGFTFWETGREGARQPESLWARGNTVLVGVAQARDIEFVADRPGEWMFHCHLPHHMMNQMTPVVGPMTRLGPGVEAGRVPLFPQDAYMEGPMMAMDKQVDKPETYGLPAGWSGYAGGMMTLVRVLPPERYQKIMDLKAQSRERLV
jgi:manganese oxidase